jgi:hypothetical protein
VGGEPCRGRAGFERRHRLLLAVVAEHELIEVRLELGTTDAMMGTDQPVLKIADHAIGEWYDRSGALAERRPERLLERDVLTPRGFQAGECPEPVGVIPPAATYSWTMALIVVAVKSGRTTRRM